MRRLFFCLMLAACGADAPPPEEVLPVPPPSGAVAATDDPLCPYTPSCVCTLPADERPARIWLPEKLRALAPDLPPYIEVDCDNG